MTAPNDATWPEGWGGYCQLHRLALPCPSCTSAVPIQPPPPVFIPGGYPVPPVSYPPQPAAPAANPDPWMYYTPLPVPGYPCPSCGQHVPGEWSHEDFDDD